MSGCSGQPSEIMLTTTSSTTTDPYNLPEFTDWLHSWGASENTIETRLVVAKQAARLWPDPSTVTPGSIVTFLANPAYSSQWTRATYYSHLRSLFGWLHERGSIPDDPTKRVRRPRPPKHKPRPLTPAEAELVLKHAHGFMRTWLILGLFAGFRAHETAKIRGDDVHEDVIYVRGKGGKDAVVPTHSRIWEEAQLYDDGYWFPSTHGSIHSDQISARVTAFFREFGITGSYHRCRHTYGTGLLRGGTNLRVVQTLMRHESLATTAAYLAVDDDERADAIRKLGT